MWIDKRAEFSASVALTASGAIGDYLNVGGDFDIGPGVPLYWNLVVLVAPDHTTGNESYVFTLETDSDSAFGSATTIASVTVANTEVAGFSFSVSIPMANEQYIRAYATLGGTTPSITVASWIGATPISQRRYYNDAV